MMDNASFLRLVARDFYPVLRTQGFAGSGNTLRRINGPLVHVVNLQGSRYGEEFFVNVGATLTFLEMHGVTASTAAKVKEYECVFRGRLDRSAGASRQWVYGVDETDAASTIEDLQILWERDGVPWFERYGAYPGSFLQLIHANDVGTHRPAHLYTLARIAFHLGEPATCRALAIDALERTPERASLLKRDLSALLKSI